MYLKRTMTLSNNFSSSSSDHSLFPDFSCTSTYFAGESRGGKEGKREERVKRGEREGRKRGEGGEEREGKKGGVRYQTALAP